MAITSKLNWLVIAVILLAVVNLAFLGFIWFEQKEKEQIREQPKDARDYLVTELNLNNKQQQQFDSLRKIHFQQMNTDRNEMRKLKDAFFGQLQNDSNSAANGLGQQIGDLQTKIDLNTFHHFAALRSICSNEQKQKFDKIIQNVLINMGRPGMAEGPPPREDRQGPAPPEDAPPH